MVKLRTTINPTEVLDVDDGEAADLKAMGLVLKSQATTDKGLISAAVRQVTGTTESGTTESGDDAGDDSQEG